MNKFALCIFGKNTMEVMLCPSQHPTKRYMICHVTGDLNCDHSAKVVSARFPHCEVNIFPLLLISIFWGSYFATM